MRPPGLCWDRTQGKVPMHLHRAVEEEGQVVLGESEDAPLGVGEVSDQAEVDGVQLVALADGPGLQVLGKGLARLVVFGQPVTGPGRKQGIGQGTQLLFQFQVGFRHGVLFLIAASATGYRLTRTILPTVSPLANSSWARAACSSGSLRSITGLSSPRPRRSNSVARSWRNQSGFRRFNIWML